MKDRDRFGNALDPAVGYARGTILRSSLEDSLRRAHTLQLIRHRVERYGRAALFNFTGHRRGFPAAAVDLDQKLAEEWVGSALVEERLAAAAQAHLGAGSNAGVALFNRSSAGIVALILALVPRGGRAVSVAPRRRTHPSVRRGMALAGATLIELDAAEPVDLAPLAEAALVVVTRVSSELDIMPAGAVEEVVAAALRTGRPVFIDDAYGARVAPILLGQPRTLEFGADLGITSCDKAGLEGPRAGLLAGSPDLVDRIVARASELGLEARAPLMLGVLRTLERFDPGALREEARVAREVATRLRARFGVQRVQETLLGPTIPEEDVLSIAVERGGRDSDPPVLVPAEASCALGMILLERHGMLTSNAAERPGARVSLRLRPHPEEVARFGGPEKVVDVIDDAFRQLGEIQADPLQVEAIILGPRTPPGRVRP